MRTRRRCSARFDAIGLLKWRASHAQDFDPKGSVGFCCAADELMPVTYAQDHRPRRMIGCATLRELSSQGCALSSLQPFRAGPRATRSEMSLTPMAEVLSRPLTGRSRSWMLRRPRGRGGGGAARGRRGIAARNRASPRLGGKRPSRQGLARLADLLQRAFSAAHRRMRARRAWRGCSLPIGRLMQVSWGAGCGARNPSRPLVAIVGGRQSTNRPVGNLSNRSTCW